MLGLNAFSDLSNKEFKARFTPFGSLNSDKTNCKPQIASDETNVKEIDWQTLGAVTPVKDQGQCGSCWSFSATGAIEGAVYNSNEGKSKSLQSFSEQQLVDCSKMYGNLGCNGGLMDNAFKYVIDNGICTETAYPYTATSSITETCKSKSCVPNKSVCECVDVIPSSTKDLMRAVSITPVSVAIQADATTFQMYKSGVYTDIKCGTDLNHGVLVVGYGVDTESQLPYWRVKNSWGTDWGDEGYIKILRSEGDGICGIAMQPSYVQTC
jgi:cathepsin L